MSLRKRLALTVLLFISLGFLAGCGTGKNEIRTYTIPREHKSVESGAHETHDHAAHQEKDSSEIAMETTDTGSVEVAPPVPGVAGLTWSVPDTWKELEPSSMRLGSFGYIGKNGQRVDISVISLPGVAGGLLANVNRWRGQIKLSPLDQAGLEDALQKVPVSGHEGVMVEFVSAEKLIDNAFHKRLVAVVLSYQGATYFFKMAGEDMAVNENGESFLAFLETLKFS